MERGIVEEFLSQRRFAVVGATNRKEKYGYKIFKDLKEKGYEVYPVHPVLQEIEGVRCYPTLSQVPVKVDVVDIVVPPRVTEKIVEECAKLKIKRVWMQPGAESEKAIKFCKTHRIKVIYGICVMRESEVFDRGKGKG